MYNAARITPVDATTAHQRWVRNVPMRIMNSPTKPFLDRIEPSVKALITHVEEHSNAKEPATANAVANGTEASK